MRPWGHSSFSTIRRRSCCRAVDDGTTVLAIGGTRGESFRVSPWEFSFAATPSAKAERYADAEALVREGLERHPGNAALLYDLACYAARQGRRDEALNHLCEAVESQPKYLEFARTDPDLDSIRGDPRFPK
jgi:tetratricopeptide (TPR) repeat protein